MTRHRSRVAAMLLLAATLGLSACTGDGDPTPGPTGAATPTAAAPDPGVPTLVAEPVLDPLWLDTIGLPVVAAVRTSTGLARMADLDDTARAERCRTVATDLEQIGPPELLVGLAITADEETATLLVADLQAKAELLAACTQGGEPLEALVAEVARTHATAVAWLAAVGA